MQLSDIIASDAVVPSLRAASKKQVLQELSNAAAKITGVDSRRIFECLLQREKLGSTGLGQGIAIPHAKFNELDRVQGLFARLAPPRRLWRFRHFGFVEQSVLHGASLRPRARAGQHAAAAARLGS